MQRFCLLAMEGVQSNSRIGFIKRDSCVYKIMDELLRHLVNAIYEEIELLNIEIGTWLKLRDAFRIIICLDNRHMLARMESVTRNDTMFVQHRPQKRWIYSVEDDIIIYEVRKTCIFSKWIFDSPKICNICTKTGYRSFQNRHWQYLSCNERPHIVQNV